MPINFSSNTTTYVRRPLSAPTKVHCEHLHSLRERYSLNAQQTSAADARVGIHYLEHLAQQRNAISKKAAETGETA